MNFHSIGDPNWNVCCCVGTGVIHCLDRELQGWPLGEEQALPLLKHAWDRGVNTWDTANVYSSAYISLILDARIIISDQVDVFLDGESESG